jgi:hypothetical protein
MWTKSFRKLASGATRGATESPPEVRRILGFLQVRRNCPYRVQGRTSTRAGNARNVKSVGIAYATHARPAEFYKFRHPNRSYQTVLWLVP